MKRGRKSLTGKTKGFLLRVRLDEDEHARAAARCAELGKGISTHARDLLIADCPPLAGTSKKTAKPVARKNPRKKSRG